MISGDHILCTNDGFCMLSKSVSDILISGGIDTFPDSQGKTMECRYFFDDWFLFAVPDRDSHICGLLKMREQEDDRKRGIDADGDTPGVTISFIAFDADAMKRCLAQPTAKEAGIQADKQYLPITIVEDGYVSRENLRKAEKDDSWLESVLNKNRSTLADTILLTVDRANHVVFIGKEQP